MKWLYALLATTLTICASFCLIEGGLLARTARTVQLKEVDSVLQQSSKVLSHTDEAATQIDAATTAQFTTLNLISKEALRSSAAFKNLVVDTDREVNGGYQTVGVLPATEAILSDLHDRVDIASTDFDVDLKGIQPIESGLVKVEDLATTTIGDPAIHDSFTHLDDASKGLDGMATDGHTETSLIVGQTRQAFTPKNRFLSIITGLSNGTLTVAELAYYLHRQP